MVYRIMHDMLLFNRATTSVNLTEHSGSGKKYVLRETSILMECTLNESP